MNWTRCLDLLASKHKLHVTYKASLGRGRIMATVDVVITSSDEREQGQLRAVSGLCNTRPEAVQQAAERAVAQLARFRLACSADAQRLHALLASAVSTAVGRPPVLAQPLSAQREHKPV